MGIGWRRPGVFLTLALSALIALCVIPLMKAEDSPAPRLEPISSQAVAFAVSLPASELPSAAETNGDKESREVPEREIGIGDGRPQPVDNGATDTVQQFTSVGPLLAPPSLSFDGLSNQDNFNTFGARVTPPDTNGDVGPNHYVQAVNTLWRVWDKNGNALTPPLRLSGLFAPIGAPCSLQSKGDVVVLYDPLADRWLISQLGFATTPLVPPYFECIAISQSPDPTGAYYLYAFQTAGNELPDYPKLGVWPDGYYMTVNQFTSGGPFNGTGAYAFDRTKMLNGDPTANYVYFNLSLASHPEAIFGMLPSDFDGLIPPPPGRPNTFAYFTSLVFSGASDALRLFDFHVDFTNTASSTFTERAESPIAVAPFNPTNPSNRSDIAQSGTPVGLDSISDRLMHRLQYRNFGNTESLVANHTVGATPSTVLGTYRAGVRYYQLKRGSGAFSIAEQATYAPADGLSRWMGSAATDNQGNLMVGFSTSSPIAFPSIAVAGRLATDLPGGLFQGESVLVAGTGVQTGSNRWGDYSALAVDPSDDCTFWYTNEYFTAASQVSSPIGWTSRIGRLKFPTCTAPVQGTLVGTITDGATGNPVVGAFIRLSNGFSATSLANGTYSRVLTPGTYDVTVSRLGYLPVTRTGVVIGGGTVTTLNLSMTGTPAMAPGATAISAEGFSPANGAIDAGETVTVNFTVLNIGFGSTTDLTATLLPSGGVLEPSGLQHYGAIPAGGNGTRSFTFRADPLLGCAGKLTATLHLQDGANDLGNVAFDFQLAGNLITVFSENFDGVTAPTLPAGWIASNPDASPVLWVTSATGSVDTPPNVAFVTAPEVVSDKRLDSPAILIHTTTAQLRFSHAHVFQTALDGGVLEISIDGGAFVDILAAGGTFALNGYNTAMTPGSGNPLAGRMAWSATVNRLTIVNLPAAAAGKFVKLRWRMGSDASVGSPAGTGWSVDSIVITELLSACIYNVVAGGSVLKSESFLPGNAAIDAGETASVDFTLRNTGTAGTTNLVATLVSSGGVLSPSSPQSYGAIPAGGAATRTFSFRADPLLGCGGTLTATLHIQDGSTDLGTIAFLILLAGNRTTVFSENFDGVTVPLLPAGWVSSKTDASPTLWVTDLVAPDTAPNDAFINGPDPLGDKRLDSVPILVKTATAQVTFRHWNILQAGFDGGVLEISLDGGAFVDILAAGGTFVTTPYDAVISSATGNPIGGRMAWTGNQTGYRTTTANLPPSAAGKSVRLRWRLGSDNSTTSAGWRVDTVLVTEITTPCNYNFVASNATIAAESFVPPNNAIDPGENVSVNFTLANLGTQSTSNTTASLLSTGGVTNPSSPQAYGAVAGNGGTGTKLFTFRADPTLICGGPLTATQQIFESGVDLGIVKFNFNLGTLQKTTRLAENFDGVVAPLLPLGWVSTTPDASPVLWVTSNITPDTAPNDAFVADPASVSDRRLDSPAFTVQSNAAQLTFRNNYILDPNFDGGVLEISIDGAPFVDILSAGGSFAQNGYNGSISIGELNPLDGRRAWTGSSGGYITTVVNLPAGVAGKSLKLRWRMGSGLTIGGTGWRIDTISVVDNIQLCSTGTNTTTSLTSSLNPSMFGQLVTYTATVSATGGSGKPTGNVTFKDGGVPMGSLPLDNAGQASGTAALSVGSHSITAEYSGDGNFNASTSPSLTQVVNATGTASVVGSIGGKSGPSNARVWTIFLNDDGPGPANNVLITGFTLTQTFGPACTPVVTVPASFPISLGSIAAGATASAPVTINFSSCSANARFTVNVPFTANAGAVSGAIVRYNQFQ